MVVAAFLAPQEPKLAGDYEKKGKQIGGLSFTLLKNFGMSEEAISARYDLFTNSMMNAMQKNCTNIAILLQRYLNFCQRLVARPPCSSLYAAAERRRARE